MSGNRGQKNLEELKKIRPQNCYMETCSPQSPAILPWGKRTHFHPLCPKFNIVWGEKGFFLAVIPTNITGKVPPLLTSNVPK